MVRTFFYSLFFICSAALASDSVHLDRAPIDIRDYVSMQRGAKTFMQECSGCHSLQYMRYDALAKGIEITDEEGKVLSKIVKDNLMFTADNLSDPIKTAMHSEDAANWFGVTPPDLSLISRVRGVDWLYTYLRAFYVDPNRPWGVNNTVFADTAMPHVLAEYQGEQLLENNKLVLSKKGSMTSAEYDSMVADLVNFLAYVGEPIKVERQTVGAWVLVFLGIFIIFSYLLKREFWKDVE